MGCFSIVSFPLESLVCLDPLLVIYFTVTKLTVCSVHVADFRIHDRNNKTIYFYARTFNALNCHLWWPISAITCQIIMSTSQIFMLTCLIIMSICQTNIITTSSLISCFYSVLLHLIAIYLSIKYLTSRHHYLTSCHNFLTSRQNDLESVIVTKKLCFQTMMSNCQILCRLVRSLC